MCAGAEQLGTKLTVSADKRITRFGRFLRQSKIDEHRSETGIFHPQRVPHRPEQTPPSTLADGARLGSKFRYTANKSD